MYPQRVQCQLATRLSHLVWKPQTRPKQPSRKHRYVNSLSGFTAAGGAAAGGSPSAGAAAAGTDAAGGSPSAGAAAAGDDGAGTSVPDRSSAWD